MPHLLQRELLIERPINEVFAFFSSAENLQSITPPALDFRILTPKPIEMREGALIDYRLKLSGLPLGWRTRIDVWQPPYRFVDSQVQGPYRRWVHEHTFEVVSGGTRMRDQVEYEIPGGPLEPLVHRFFVGPKVRQIFAFREATILRLMG